MKLYNPTDVTIQACFNGKNYWIEPSMAINIQEVAGHHILEVFSKTGVVDMTVPVDTAPDQVKNFVVTKILEGLYRYLDGLHERAEGFMKFDEELKEKNIHATILRHKVFRKCTKSIEDATAMIKEFEAKYGIELRKAEVEKKKADLFASVENLLSEFDKEKDANLKATEYEREVNGIIDDVLKRSQKQQDTLN